MRNNVGLLERLLHTLNVLRERVKKYPGEPDRWDYVLICSRTYLAELASAEGVRMPKVKIKLIPGKPVKGLAPSAVIALTLLEDTSRIAERSIVMILSGREDDLPNVRDMIRRMVEDLASAGLALDPPKTLNQDYVLSSLVIRRVPVLRRDPLLTLKSKRDKSNGKVKKDRKGRRK